MTTVSVTSAGAAIRDRLINVVDAITALNYAASEIDSTMVEESAQILRTLRQGKETLGQIEAGLERWIAACFREEGWRDPREMPGVGMVEVRRSNDRRAWQHDRVRADWLNAYMDKVGGEVTDPAAVRDAFLEVAQVSGYKVTGLRGLGLDPGDYCDTTPGTPRVVIA